MAGRMQQKDPAHGASMEPPLSDQECLKIIRLFDGVFKKPPSAAPTPDKVLQAMVLLHRSSCYARLNDQESVISDSKRALKLLAEMRDVTTTVCYVKRCLILALYKKQKLSHAEDMVREWLNQLYAMSEERKQPIAVLERYLVIFQLSSSGAGGGKRPQQTILDTEMQQLDEKLNNWIRDCMPGDQLTENALHPFRLTLDSHATAQQLLQEGSSNGKTATAAGNTGRTSEAKKQQQQQQAEEGKGKRRQKNRDPETFKCTYCALTFDTRSELTVHCQSESHQIVIMSDEGRDWLCRPPPRGYSADTYSACESFMETGVCHFGGQCIEAHGAEELSEWKQRFEYRRMRVERAREIELYGKSYTETLLEKWVSAAAPDQVMRESIDYVQEADPPPLSSVVSSKVSEQQWTFTLHSTRDLHAVSLLQDAYRSHFRVQEIIRQEGSNPVHITNDQEWVRPEAAKGQGGQQQQQRKTIRVSVVFATDIYGTFRQSVVFDFGTEPVLVKHICVDVLPVGDLDKMAEIKKDLVVHTAQRWDDANTEIIPFESGFVVPQTPEQLADAEYEKQLLERYPCPSAQTLQLSQSTISEKRLTKNNYRNRMHELLFVEEIARYETVARFNLTTKLRVTANYLLTPCGMASTSAKYSNDGELFALLQLRKDISEDTSAGRLVLNNCTAVHLALAEDGEGEQVGKRRRVYETLIEDKGKNSIYMKLSPRTVRELRLKSDMEIRVDIQFKLNRLTFCEWHRAVDKVADYRLIFPDTLAPPSIPWTPQKQWMDVLDGAKLNAKQKEAVLAITSPQTVPLPPILLIGPFGTGKTFTLALAIKQLLVQPEPRILICTHSNSAADLYIKEYLHPWVTDEGLAAARPLRVYYHKRWVATVHPTVQEYCLIDTTPSMRSFRRPTVEDVTQHRIVVVTLSISQELASLDLPKGFFTHIFLDEAAQAMECEAIMALGLASDTSKIVLAGDHMQMSPELFSEFAKERNMHMSLLERLYDHYPTDFPTKILLCENYRAHEAIIRYTSELFYDQKLVASGKQPRHDTFYPLTFFTTRGEDVQDRNSTTFYNNAEVYEVVERVAELVAMWPKEWGEVGEGSVGIMTPYADQVMRIRMELRRRKLGKINVERVLNVQGKQFRVVFLSTVRTRKTCPGQDKVAGAIELDYGFLSNSKLLNTAITRAQSLVAVVGDPVALCSIGRCRKVWERFIETCNENGSLFGITWSMLRAQLDGVELKKAFVLNPLAPEFVPRAEMMRRMMLSGGDYGMYYTAQESGSGGGGFPPKGQFNHHMTGGGGGGGGSMVRPGGNGGHPRPYLNIEDAMESHHRYPQGPKSRPCFNAPPVGPPVGMGKFYPSPPQYPQQPPPSQLPQSGYDRPLGPGPMNNQQPPAMNGGPGPVCKWGPVPPNINPQLTGTNAWQMNKSPQGVGHPLNQQMQPKMMPLNRSPTHNSMMGMNQVGQQPWVMQNGPGMGSNGGGVQSPMMDFMGPSLQNPLSQMNMPQQQPQQPPMAMRNNGMRVPPGIASQFPPQVSPTEQELFHRLQMQQQLHFQQQQMRMCGPQLPPPPPPDLASMAALQERLMLMNGRQPVMNASAIGALLPPHRTIYEMAVETKDVQLKWFTRLVETHGWDAAYKFAEMMGQAQSVMVQRHQQMSRTQQQQQSMGNSLSVQQQQQQQQQLQMLNSSSMLGRGRSSPPNVRQMDVAFESLISGQPMQRLMFEDHPAVNAAEVESSRRLFEDGLFASPLLGGVVVPEGSSTSSVPLYRRQAGQSTTSSSSVSSMSSQSANNGWMGVEHHGGVSRVGDGLFHPLAEDKSAEATMTYASVLSQAGNGRRDEVAGRGMNGPSSSMAAAATTEEEKKMPSLDLQVGHRNGFYNYFG